MTNSENPLWPTIENARVSWSGDNLYSEDFDDIYGSYGGNYGDNDDGHDPLLSNGSPDSYICQESLYVFFDGCQIRKKLGEQESLFIGELGFGAGINFFTTALEYQKKEDTICQTIHYFAVEKFPLKREIFEQILTKPAFGALHELIVMFLEQFPDFIPGYHSLHFQLSENKKIFLTLYYGSAQGGISSLSFPHQIFYQKFQKENSNTSSGIFDAWYLDGFKPTTNFEMFEENLLKKIYALSNDDVIVATYSAAAKVKQSMQNAGFETIKTAGFGKKRHRLLAHKKKSLDPKSSKIFWHHFPWLLPAVTHTKKEAPKVAVVGSGLAGLSFAHHLRQLMPKAQIQLYESRDKTAPLSSSNSRGLLFPIISAKPTIFSSYSWQAYHFALKKFSQIQNVYDIEFDPCGIYQYFLDSDLRRRFEKAQGDLKNYSIRSLPLVEAEIPAEKKYSLPLKEKKEKFEGIFYPHGATLSAAKLCQFYAQDFEIKTHSKVLSFEYLENTEQPWRLDIQTPAHRYYQNYDIVVLACSHQVDSFVQTNWLKLHKRWGQISVVEAVGTLDSLDFALCGDGYLTQQKNGALIAGASYRDETTTQPFQNNEEYFTSLHPSEHHQILEKIKKWLPAELAAEFKKFSTEEIDNLSGNVGCRVSCVDHLPLIGAIPDVEKYRGEFSGLDKGPRHLSKKIQQGVENPFHRGLYMISALGSRGLLYSQLGSLMLARQVAGGVIPLQKEIVEAFAPARFLNKELARI